MEDPYAQIKTHFAAVAGAQVNEGRGSQGIKCGKKMFAMFYKGDLLLKLAPERVAQLIASGVGTAYDPGNGTAMKDRVIVRAEHSAQWIELAEESLRHAGG